MILELAFKRHKNWIEIVESFGCNRDTAEDIVQEMYIRLDRLSKSGSDITYKNDINYFYVFKMLSTMFLDLKKKEIKTTFIDLEEIKDLQSYDAFELSDFQKQYEIVQNALEELYWYDKKVYEIIDDGESISSLSRKTNISYASLYNTYRKVLKHLKSKL
jgi:DNA-directed RNA polymerase specialized sigma24 family protein